MIEHTVRNVETAKQAPNDSGTMEVDLGRIGGIAAIFLRLRATNGAGGSASYGLRAAITEIRVKTGDHRYPFRLSASDLYAINTIRDGVAEELSEGTGGGVVQSVRLPIKFGLGENSLDYGIDLAACEGASLEVDYTLVIHGGDGFATKSLRLDVDVLETKDQKRPMYAGKVETSIANQHLTKVQDPAKVKLNATKNMIGLYAYAYLAGTADSALVSNIKLMEMGNNNPVVDRSFADLQYSRRTLSGGIVTSYAPIWISPGRQGGAGFKPFPGDEAELHLRELVADGSVRVIMETTG